MSRESDRIAVPTNGKGPHRVTDPAPALAPTTPEASGAPTAEDMSVAFTPKQLAIGFGIIASLVLLLVSRTRGRRNEDDDAD